MIKFSSLKLREILMLSISFLSCIQLYASPPKWSSGYPQAINGATSIDLTFNTDQNSTIYYVVYNSLPSNISSSSIISDAKSSVSGNISGNGSISIPAQIDTKAYITGLTDGNTYFVYAIAENTNGEIQNVADIKSFNLSLPLRQSPNSYKTSLVQNAIIGYLAYFPEAYYKNPSADYPVLIFLHGSGEKTWLLNSNSQLNAVKANGPPKLIDEGQEFPFIVISPQCPFASWDNIDTTSNMHPGIFVNEIVEMVKSTYRVDVNRLYISGLSMGGAGTFSYIQNFPGKMAAAIPVAGWGDPTKECVLKDLPLWAFQGEYDGGETIKDLIGEINLCNSPTAEKAIATIYPGVGHDAWTETYNNTGPGIAPDNIYNWLMRHTLNNTVNQIPVSNAGTDKVITLPTENATLTGSGSDPDGTISSYSWTQQSGPTAVISGANTPMLFLNSLTAGNYIFRLTVFDNGNASAYDDVLLTVNPAPVDKPPVANAGADTNIVLPASSVIITGKGTDPDGTVVSYVWTQQSGPSAAISGANTPVLSLSSLVQGSYVFRLTVTDNNGISSYDDMTLLVSSPIVTTSASLQISGLVLADADKSIEIGPFPDGYVLNLASTSVQDFTVLVKTPSTDIGSIAFYLDGSLFRIEDNAPFSLTGNCYPGYQCYGAYWRPAVGTHTVTATPYSAAGGTGTTGASVTVNFTVVNTAVISTTTSTTTLLLTGLTLADADNSTEIGPLPDGYTLNLSQLGVKDYTVLAKTGSSDIGSVVFHLDGGLFRIEDNAPFSLTGNCYPGYNCYGAYWQFSVGTHTVTATAYSGAGGTGTAGTSLTSTFNVISSSSRVSDDEQTNNSQAYTVAPNPFNDIVSLSFNAPVSGSVKISLVDVLGAVVYTKTFNGETQNGLQLDLSGQDVKPGVYTLQVISDNQVKNATKIVKQ